MSQSNRAWTLTAISASALIERVLSSQHGIIDVVCLLYRYMEFARSGAVNHGEEDHLVAKLCDVLMYHLRQKCHDLAPVSAKVHVFTVIQQRCDKLVIPCSSSLFSICKNRGSQRQGFD